MEKHLSLLALVAAATLSVGGAVAMAEEDPSAWTARLSTSVGPAFAVGSGNNLPGGLMSEPQRAELTQANFVTPASGWTELVGSLVACGLLLRVLQRARAV